MGTQDAPTGRLMERVGAASGVVYFLLLLVGGAMMTAGGTQATRPTGEQTLADLRRHAESTSAAVGLALALLGFAAFAVFLGYLYGCCDEPRRSGVGFRRRPCSPAHQRW